jgi:hypothetical protein
MCIRIVAPSKWLTGIAAVFLIVIDSEHKGSGSAALIIFVLQTLEQAGVLALVQVHSDRAAAIPAQTPHLRGFQRHECSRGSSAPARLIGGN